MIKIEATTDYDTPHRIMIGDELNDKSEARKLKNEIAALREFMLTVVKEKELPEQLKLSISKSLDTEPPAVTQRAKRKIPRHATWEYHKFGHSPLMGFLAIMSSLQIDLRNAESEMINYLYAQISAGEVKFNELEAVVIPNSNYIIKGNPVQGQYIPGRPRYHPGSRNLYRGRRKPALGGKYRPGYRTKELCKKRRPELYQSAR